MDPGRPPGRVDPGALTLPNGHPAAPAFARGKLFGIKVGKFPVSEPHLPPCEDVASSDKQKAQCFASQNGEYARRAKLRRTTAGPVLRSSSFAGHASLSLRPVKHGLPGRSSLSLDVARLRPLSAGYGVAVFVASFAVSEDWPCQPKPSSRAGRRPSCAEAPEGILRIRCAGEGWCPRGDSNPHAVKHRLLRPACLPVPPPGQKADGQKTQPRGAAQEN